MNWCGSSATKEASTGTMSDDQDILDRIIQAFANSRQLALLRTSPPLVIASGKVYMVSFRGGWDARFGTLPAQAQKLILRALRNEMKSGVTVRDGGLFLQSRQLFFLREP
jgi:hypothetical protein